MFYQRPKLHFVWLVLCSMLLVLAACGGAPPVAENPSQTNDSSPKALDNNADVAAVSGGGSHLSAPSGVVVLLTPLAVQEDQPNANQAEEPTPAAGDGDVDVDGNVDTSLPAASTAMATDMAIEPDEQQMVTPIPIDELDFPATHTPTHSPTRLPTATPTATPRLVDEQETATRISTSTPTPTPTATEESMGEPLPTLDPRPVVPSLIGMTEQQARNRLIQLEPTLLVVVEETEQCTTDGRIVGTFPGAGDPIDPNSQMVLTVCTVTAIAPATPIPIPTLEPTLEPTPEPAPTLLMPSLVGLTEGQARNTMAQLGAQIPVQTSYQVAGCTEDGIVTATSPAAGMAVNPTVGVVLTLCVVPTPEPEPPTPTPLPQPEPSGPLMPYVIGKHPDEVRKQLQDIGVEPSFELVRSDCDSQTVVSSYPAAGEPIDFAMGVSIGVCAPPPDN